MLLGLAITIRLVQPKAVKIPRLNCYRLNASKVRQFIGLLVTLGCRGSLLTPRGSIVLD
jgi:hypothetical protein